MCNDFENPYSASDRINVPSALPTMARIISIANISNNSSVYAPNIAEPEADDIISIIVTKKKITLVITPKINPLINASLIFPPIITPTNTPPSNKLRSAIALWLDRIDTTYIAKANNKLIINGLHSITIIFSHPKNTFFL